MGVVQVGCLSVLVWLGLAVVGLRVVGSVSVPVPVDNAVAVAVAHAGTSVGGAVAGIVGDGGVAAVMGGTAGSVAWGRKEDSGLGTSGG